MSRRHYLLLAVVTVSLVAVAAAVFGIPSVKTGAPPPDKPVVWVNHWHKLPPRVDHFAFKSAAMGHAVGVTVQRPAHNQPAPLILFLHGRGGDETSDLAAVMAFLQPILVNLRLPEPLVVFPNGGLTGYEGPMATMLVDELLPHLENKYRLLPESRFRLLAGFSMGGGGAVRLLLQHPEKFGGAASWGGGFWHGDTQVLQTAVQKAEALRSRSARFLLVNGSEDRPAAFAPFAEVLQHENVLHELVVVPGVGHSMGDYFLNSAPHFSSHLRVLWQPEP